MLNFFKKTALGIDIADRSIEVAVLERRGDSIFTAGKGRIVIPKGIVTKGRVEAPDDLAKLLKEALKEAEVTMPLREKHTIVFGLPESQIYTYVTEFPKDKDWEEERLLEKVKEEVRQGVPVIFEEVLFSYSILRESKNRVEVLIIATMREVVQEWRAFFKGAGITIDIFDVEILGTFRGLFPMMSDEPVCIVDIGAHATSISIFDKDGLSHAYTLPKAGDFLSEELSRFLNISFDQAEMLKKKDGIENYQGKGFLVLVKVLEEIAKDIENAISFFESKSNRKVRRIICVGGTSYLRGILDYFRSYFPIPVRLGMQSIVKASLPLYYVEAVGLAFRGLDNMWNRRDPMIAPHAVEEPTAYFEEEQMFLGKVQKSTSVGVVIGKNAFIVRGRMAIAVAAFFILLALGIGILTVWYAQNKLHVPPIDTEALYPQEKKEPAAPRPTAGGGHQGTSTAPQSEGAPSGERSADGADVLPEVTVTDTPTGWLNVREGPGTIHRQIERVYPGESYPLLLETSDGKWYKIKINELEAWIYALYAEKKE